MWPISTHCLMFFFLLNLNKWTGLQTQIVLLRKDSQTVTLQTWAPYISQIKIPPIDLTEAWHFVTLPCTKPLGMQTPCKLCIAQHIPRPGHGSMHKRHRSQMMASRKNWLIAVCRDTCPLDCLWGQKRLADLVSLRLAVGVSTTETGEPPVVCQSFICFSVWKS
jgi:hypothetical protein